MSTPGDTFAPNDRQRKYYRWNNGKPFFEVHGLRFENIIGHNQHCIFSSEEQAIWAKHIFKAIGGFRDWNEDEPYGFIGLELEITPVEEYGYVIEFLEQDDYGSRLWTVGYMMRCEHQPKLVHLYDEVTSEVTSPRHASHGSLTSARVRC